jgi:hypothetical protein
MISGPGAEDQVLDRPRDEDLGGLGERGDAVGDVHGGPGDVVADEVHFTGVDSGTQLDPSCGGVVAEGRLRSGSLAREQRRWRGRSPGCS